jgi:hypothetical protein
LVEKEKTREKREKEEMLIRTKIPKDFFVSTLYSGFVDRTPLVMDEKISWDTLKKFQTDIKNQSYIIYENRKFWFVHTRKVLNSATKAQT